MAKTLHGGRKASSRNRGSSCATFGRESMCASDLGRRETAPTPRVRDGKRTGFSSPVRTSQTLSSSTTGWSWNWPQTAVWPSNGGKRPRRAGALHTPTKPRTTRWSRWSRRMCSTATRCGLRWENTTLPIPWSLTRTSCLRPTSVRHSPTGDSPQRTTTMDGLWGARPCGAAMCHPSGRTLPRRGRSARR